MLGARGSREGGGGAACAPALPQYHRISAPLIKTLRHADSSAGGGLRGVQGGSLPLPLALVHSHKAAAAASVSQPATICAHLLLIGLHQLLRR